MDLIGHVDQITRTRVEGWVIDKDRPGESVSVSVFVNGIHRGSCLTTHERKDTVLPGGEVVTGKCAFYLEFNPPLSPFFALRVEVMETWTAEVLLNGSRVLPRPRSHGGPDDGRVPIVLSSTGRAGTTLLMSEFARHPNIIIGDQYPYEIKQIAYHAAAFRALAADGDRERSTTPETMLDPRMRQIIGSNPYNMSGLFGLGGTRQLLRDFWQTTVPTGYATLFRSFILEFYATLANAQNKRLAPYFCEKADIDDAAVQGARVFFHTVKDIAIVRDPRDLLCSAIAFWKLRPDAAMTMLTTTIPQLTRVARRGGKDTIVVRYEDLVRDRAGSRLALSNFLKLDLLSPTLGKADTVPDSHRTSADPAASIGRWRNDLTAEQIEACEVSFEFYMREFGYERAGQTRLSRAERERTRASIVVAEGPRSVAAFAANTLTVTDEAVLPRPALDLTFGREGAGEGFVLEGWSIPERGFVWSCAGESQVRLPAIREAGSYRLYITAAPFTHGTALPGQRVTVLLDGTQAGFARVSDICVLSINVPAAVAGSGHPITLTLRFPDAARPSDIIGSEDDRTLGFSLHRIVIFQIAMARSAVDDASAPADRRTPRKAAGDPVRPAVTSARVPRSRRAHLPVASLTGC
jgi:hypothetical protein